MKRYKNDDAYLEELNFVDFLNNAQLDDPVKNWHQWDALMALLACLKHKNGTAEAIGDPLEWIIYFWDMSEENRTFNPIDPEKIA